MNFISKMRTMFPKLNAGHYRWEEFEIAPGLKCTIGFEDNRLPEAVDRFLRKKATIGELRRVSKNV